MHPLVTLKEIMPGMFQDLGLQSKSCNPHREDVIVKAEPCGDLSKKQQQQFLGCVICVSRLL